jgi:hypothetical protein
MKTKNAYLSGTNRLTCTQARAIRDLNESYDIQFSVGGNCQDSTLISANSKISNSIHQGRLADMSKENTLSIDEATVLKARLEMILRTRTYTNRFQKNAINAAIETLIVSVEGHKKLRAGRNRLHTLDKFADDWGWDEDRPVGEPDSSGLGKDISDNEYSDEDAPF